MPRSSETDNPGDLNRQFQNIGEYPVIVALQGPLEGMKWDVKGDLVIGREPNCDISINDRQVSRNHARISTTTNGKILLEDLASKNGIIYNGKPLEIAAGLEDGDIFQIALIQRFAFYVSDATLPLEDIVSLRLGIPGKIKLDLVSRRVWVGKKELLPPLSAPQFRLLHALSKQSGKVISRNELIGLVWQDEERDGISEQAFDALIRRLRARLAEVDPETEFLVTVRGHGLRLDN
jgi:pSer/pThr/pTyr-binding forkhead associated (FHA) protein